MARLPKLSVWDGEQKLLETQSVHIALANLPRGGQIRAGAAVMFDQAKEGADWDHTWQNVRLIFKRYEAAHITSRP